MKGSGGILAILAVLAAGYLLRERFQSAMNSVSTGSTPSCLEMTGSTTSEQEGATYIVGSVRNNCDRNYGQVTILFNLDRAAGPMGNLSGGVAYAYARDIKAGELREFKTALPVSKDSTYRFDRINAF